MYNKQTKEVTCCDQVKRRVHCDSKEILEDVGDTHALRLWSVIFQLLDHPQPRHQDSRETKQETGSRDMQLTTIPPATLTVRNRLTDPVECC